MIEEKHPTLEERKGNADSSELDTAQTEVRATPEEVTAQKDAEIASLIDRLKRLQAEFENYKKRAARDVLILEDRITDQVILDFLPIFDNLARAFANFTGNEDISAFLEGVERIFAQFDQLLKQKGVSQIDAVGQRFDPTRHEALLSVPSNEEKGWVLEEFEPGYIRNERILRPCKVKVSQGKTDAKEERAE
jgi:molecular chaperone GrpE